MNVVGRISSRPEYRQATEISGGAARPNSGDEQRTSYDASADQMKLQLTTKDSERHIAPLM